MKWRYDSAEFGKCGDDSADVGSHNFLSGNDVRKNYGKYVLANQDLAGCTAFWDRNDLYIRGCNQQLCAFGHRTSWGEVQRTEPD